MVKHHQSVYSMKCSACKRNEHLSPYRLRGHPAPPSSDSYRSIHWITILQKNHSRYLLDDLNRFLEIAHGQFMLFVIYKNDIYHTLFFVALYIIPDEHYSLVQLTNKSARNFTRKFSSTFIVFLDLCSVYVIR